MRKMYSKKQIEEIAKSSGIKLYKHYLHDSNIDYKFILITTNSQPIDFSVINTFEKLNNYLSTQNVIRFTNDIGSAIQYDNEQGHCFYSIDILYNPDPAPTIGLVDDWSLSHTTDVVTSL